MKIQRLFLKRILSKNGAPIHLIWFITAKCNLRCSHCFYYAQILSHKDEFSFDEIRKTIQHLPPLLSISLTGGEPFLREDLFEITKLISKKRLTDNITLFTNGFNSENIISTTEKILLNSSNINISLGVSIDGYETEHDLFRNKKGSYQMAVYTIKGLKRLSNRFPNLRLGVGVTLHSGNQDFILDLREDIYNKFGIYPGVTLIRGDAKSSELKNVDASIYKKTVEAIEDENAVSKNKSLFETIIETRQILGQKLAYRTFVRQSRPYDCYAGSLMAIIYENGDVYPCEMLKNNKFGNLRDFDYDIKRIWESPEANQIRKWIKNKECYCTYECQYTCNTLYNIKFMPFFIINIIKWLFKKVTSEKK